MDRLATSRIWLLALISLLALAGCGDTSGGSGGSGGSSSQQTDEECIEQFNQQIAGDYWGETFNGTVGEVRNGQYENSCECGDPCAQIVMSIAQDGRYWRQWYQVDRFCSSSSLYGGMDAEGTWEVTGCGNVRLHECNGEVYDVPWELKNGELHMQMPWNVDDQTFDLNMRFEREKGICCEPSFTSNQCN